MTRAERMVHGTQIGFMTLVVAAWIFALLTECTSAHRQIVLEEAEDVCVRLYEHREFLCTTGGEIVRVVEKHASKRAQKSEKDAAAE